MTAPTPARFLPAAAALLAAAAACPAQLPEYGPLELRAREDANGIPLGASVPTGDRPHLNDRGDLVFTIDGIGPWVSRIWYNAAPLQTSWRHDTPIRLSLQEDGALTWHGLSGPPGGTWAPGFFRWTSDALDEQFPIATADGLVGSVSANTAGKVAFCRIPPGGAYPDLRLWDPATGLTTVAQGGQHVFDGGYVVQNAAGQMAVRNDQGFDRGVRRYEPDGSFIDVSELYTWSSNVSPYIDMNDHGQVAFVGSHGIHLLRSDGQTLTQLVDTLDPDAKVSDIEERVAPAINNAGWVAFRGISDDGVEGIYITDGQSVRLIAAEGDTVMSSVGPIAIGEFRLYGLDMNSAGDVAFIAELSRFRFGVIVARAGGTCRGDWNADGAVSSSDISAFLTAWLASVSKGTLDADFNADGSVNSTDIAAFLSNWMASLGPGC